MAKELNLYSDTSGLTVTASIFLNDSLIGSVPCTEGENKVYVGDMPQGLGAFEYFIEFVSDSEVVGTGNIVWDGVRELTVANVRTGGGAIRTIDQTKSHEDILSKYEKKLLEMIEEAIKNIPKTDLSSLLTAIKDIKPTDLSSLGKSLVSIRSNILSFQQSMLESHKNEKKMIEEKYSKEIEKKDSLLQKNEYNLTQKEGIIEKLANDISDLGTKIQEIESSKEEELKMMEETYQSVIGNTNKMTKDQIKEKFLTLIDN